MEELNDEQRRALEELARHPDGCAEAGLVADGFSIRDLSGLAIDGLANIDLRRVVVGGRERSVVWISITDEGRHAIAG